MKKRIENLVYDERSRILDLADLVLKNEAPVWPFTFERECKMEDCFKRPDGLWQDKRLHYSGDKHIFIWRLSPNYCVQGKPFFSAQRRYDLFKSSETSKVLLTEQDLEFRWEWYEWDQHYPSDNVWGLKMTTPTIAVYRKGTRIFHVKNPSVSGGKKELRKFLESTCWYNY